MAGGKLTPRQKVINMMYLVLTAMLALNVSREVMDFLYEDMKSKEQSISTIDMQTASMYNALNTAAANNPAKAGKYRDQALEVQRRSNELYNRIDSIKHTVSVLAGGFEEGPDGETTDKPKKMDNREKSADYFINQKNGDKLKAEIDSYRDFLIENTDGNESLNKSIAELFDTEPHEKKGEAAEKWVNHNFEHYPLISVLSTLTTIQSNIRNSEAQTVAVIKSKIGADDLNFTGVRAVVIPKSNFINQGDDYTAEVFLAAYDETQEPSIMINGQPLAAEDIKGGIGHITLPGSVVGPHTWGGEIILKQKGKETKYTIDEMTYNVSPPSVVISPTKMNVFYRNVKNPIEISVPGVDPSKVHASGPGVSRSGSGYVADVTKVSGKKMKINVTVTNEDGSTTPMGSKEFRIKGLPEAQGLFLKKSVTLASKSALKSQPIEAAYKDFVFDLKLKVISFEVKASGKAPIKVSGNRMNSTAKAVIDNLKTGSTLSIRNIKAKAPNGATVSNISSISIDVN